MTDEPSTSRVFYQKGFAASGTELAEKTSIDPNFTKKHAIVITKFDPGAIYTFKVESVDSGGNMTLSKTYTILARNERNSLPSHHEEFRIYVRMGWQYETIICIA